MIMGGEHPWLRWSQLFFSTCGKKIQPSSAELHQLVTFCGFPLNFVTHAYPLFTGYSIPNTVSHFSSSGSTFSSSAEVPLSLRIRGTRILPVPKLSDRAKGQGENHVKGQLLIEFQVHKKSPQMARTPRGLSAL